MKNFNEIMAENRLVCILRGIPEDMIRDVLDALYDGGIRLADHQQIDVHRRAALLGLTAVLERAAGAGAASSRVFASRTCGNGKSLFHSPCTSR